MHFQSKEHNTKDAPIWCHLVINWYDGGLRGRTSWTLFNNGMHQSDSTMSGWAIWMSDGLGKPWIGPMTLLTLALQVIDGIATMNPFCRCCCRFLQGIPVAFILRWDHGHWPWTSLNQSRIDSEWVGAECNDREARIMPFRGQSPITVDWISR